jgi:hypothetical protein
MWWQEQKKIQKNATIEKTIRMQISLLQAVAPAEMPSSVLLV